MIQLRGQPRPAEGEVVGPQAADGVLGQLRIEQRGEGAEGEVHKVVIELHQELWDAAVTGINVIVSKRKLVKLVTLRPLGAAGIVSPDVLDVTSGHPLAPELFLQASDPRGPGH